MRLKRRLGRFERLEGREMMAGDITQVNYYDTWDGGVVLSTDPADITFHRPSGHMFLADSEIDELGVFRGYNIFEISADGETLYKEIASGNKEPTGITYNEFDGFFYISNDDGHRTVTRYDNRLNHPLAQISTLDDSSNANDPEGITSDPVTGNLYVVCGSTGGRGQVLAYDADMQFLYKFYIDDLLPDSEGIAFHPGSQHLFILDGGEYLIGEYTLTGTLVETYDISDFSPRPLTAGGLGFGPTSNPNDSASALSLYITDRGVDNEEDGGVYEAVLGDLVDPPDENGIVDRQVNFGSDDAEESSGGSVSLNSSDIELVEDGGAQTVGLRFRNITIPAGATITKATLQFTVDETNSNPASLLIRGHDVGDAPLFASTARNVSSRPGTASSVTWDVPAWTQGGAAGAAQKSPDLSSIVHEIVNRGNWQSGNSLAFVITGSGKRTADSYEGVPSGAPRLHIEYSTDTAPNQPPAIDLIGSKRVRQTESLAFTVTASDPDGPASEIQFALEPGAPAGATIDRNTGVFAWTPSANQGPGSFLVTVVATDQGSPKQSDTRSFTITVDPPPNFAPILDAVGPRSVFRGQQLSFTATASDPDGPQADLRFSLDGDAPSGATLDAVTGRFRWTPAANQPLGDYSATIRVTDMGNPALGDSETITITVDRVPNEAPVLAPIGPRSVQQGLPLEFQAAATDPDGPASDLRYSLGSGAPAGATIDPVTGVFRWTPRQSAGNYSVTILVSDQGTPVLSDSETISVAVRSTTGPQVLDRRVASGSDDVEERQTGEIVTGDIDLQLVRSGGNQTIGLRFSDVIVPAGATITRAWVKFHAYKATSEATTLSIKADDSGDAAPFAATNFDVSGRRRTSASVGWTPAAWNVAGESGSAQRTPDLTPVIQELVDRNDWTFGSAIALILSGSGKRNAKSFEMSAIDAPRLRIEFTTDPGGATQTLESRIAASSDDAEQFAGGSVSLTSGDLAMTLVGSSLQTVGLRFANLAIPAGATIRRAYVQFAADETDSAASSLVIHGQAIGNAPTFLATSGNIGSRSRTSASAAWLPSAWTSVGDEGISQRTSDLTAIVQEIVSRGDWQSGNALALFVSGNGERVARSFDKNPATAPKFHVEF